MSELAEKMRACTGRNQARMVIKEHCEKLGVHYKDYVLTEDESAIYFSKHPYSPYSNFKMGNRERPNDN